MCITLRVQGVFFNSLCILSHSGGCATGTKRNRIGTVHFRERCHQQGECPWRLCCPDWVCWPQIPSSLFCWTLWGPVGLTLWGCFSRAPVSAAVSPWEAPAGDRTAAGQEGRARQGLFSFCLWLLLQHQLYPRSGSENRHGFPSLQETVVSGFRVLPRPLAPSASR